MTHYDVVDGWVLGLCKKPAWGRKFPPLEPPDPKYFLNGVFIYALPEFLAVTTLKLVIETMIDLELWRATIGLYVHKCRRLARVRVNIVLARETHLFTDQKNEPSMKKPPDVTKPGNECKKPQETDSGASASKKGIEEAEQQETREQTRDTLSKPNHLHSTAIINLMRMLPLFIILLLLVCGDVELNPGPTLGELMITVCVCVHEYTCTM